MTKKENSRLFHDLLRPLTLSILLMELLDEESPLSPSLKSNLIQAIEKQRQLMNEFSDHRELAGLMAELTEFSSRIFNFFDAPARELPAFKTQLLHWDHQIRNEMKKLSAALD